MWREGRAQIRLHEPPFAAKEIAMNMLSIKTVWWWAS